MLTIFSVPKAFEDHFDIIQRNAIQSWLALRPRCEIILFGNEKGVVETAAEFKVKHIPEITRNKFGTPLLNEVFAKAQKVASYQKISYLNADIILMSDFIKAFQEIKKPSFLMIGQRWDVDLKKPIRFDDINWERKLRDFVAKFGKIHGFSGIDYFVFTRGLYQNIPPFAIGRPVWDNWLIYKARSLNIPVIDATKVVMAVHQNHSYFHPQGAEGLWNGPEAKENLKLAGGYSRAFTIEDANWILTSQGLRKQKLRIKYLSRYFETLAILRPDLGSLPKIVSILLSPRKLKSNIVKRIRILLNRLS